LVLFSVAFFGHHSMAFTLLGTFGVAAVVGILLRYWQEAIGSIEFNTKDRNYTLVSLFCIVLFLYYWITVGQLRGQFNRVLGIVLFYKQTGQATIEQATAPPTIDIIGITVPAVLSWAAPLLALAIIVGLSGLLTVRKLLRHRNSGYPMQYALLGTFVMTGYGVAYLIGGRDAVIRILPEISVIVAPLVAFTSSDFLNKRGGPYFILLLIILIVGSGVMTPAVAIPERSGDVFKPQITENEVESAKWAQMYSDNISGGAYYIGYIYWNQIKSGGTSEGKELNRILTHPSPNKIKEYKNRSDGTVFVYRKYFTKFFNISRPLTDGKIYSTGQTTIHISYNGSDV